jgi:peptide-methionine (S)-S-oxide reductase
MQKGFIIILTICGVILMTNVNADEAIFAMGCFWCGESEFRDHETNEPLPGIKSIRVGFAGGTIKNPTYKHHPEYKEAVKIDFDPSVISYSKLLDIFWHNVDLFDAQGQFCDKGFPYTSVIFFENSQQQTESQESKANIEKQMHKKAVTEIISATTFYDAEEYHQNYSNKNPVKYSYYRWNCGRDQRLKEIWGN